MEQPLMVSELLPPAGTPTVLSDAQLADYERALDQFLAGNWQAAFDLLHRVPADDRVKDFVTMHIVQNNRTPPRDWQGVIPLASK
jgi:adenylate cyclase